MKHRKVSNHFGRRPNAHKALLRGLVESMVKNERIRTTLVKAKELRRHVEKAITRGKGGTVHDRRVLLSSFPNQEVVKKIVDDLSPRFKEREGGYTRIIKAGRRPGDNAEMALIEFVDYKAPTAEEKSEKAQAEAKVGLEKKAQLRRRKRKLQQKDRREARV